MKASAAPSRSRPARWASLALGASWLVAVWLRVVDLGWQIPTGDELHALRAVATQSAAELATRSHPGVEVDYSIPLALWNLLLARTVGLEEWGQRLPVLVAGVALVLAGSCFVWRAVGRLEGVVVGWWLATSPLLVFYSRFARPYMAIACLTFLALCGWLRWRETRGWRPGLVAALCGALALFFNLSSAPSILCLWGAGAVFALRDGQSAPASTDARRAWKRWALCVLIGIASAGALIGPSLAAQREFVAHIQGRGAPGWSTWWQVAGIVLGTRSDAVLVCLLSATLAGAAIAFRRSPPAASAAVLMLLAQVLAVCVTEPYGADEPLTAARYLMAAVPGTLIFSCVGLCASARWLAARLGRSRLVATAALAGMLATVVASGWLPRKYALASVDTSDLFDRVGSTWSLDPERLPAFYRALAQRSGAVTIVEWPWSPVWRLYQDFHGQRVLSLSHGAFLEPGFRFRTMVDPAEVLAGRAACDYVLLHKDPSAEWISVCAGHAIDPEDAEARSLPVLAAQSLALLRGAPGLRAIDEDEWLVVFERVGPELPQ